MPTARARDIDGRRDASSVDWRNEAIAAARNRFDEPRTFGRIAECVAELPDGAVQAEFEIDARIAGPELALQLFTRDEASGALQQNPQDLQRLVGESDSSSGLAKLTGIGIKFEDAEANRFGHPSSNKPSDHRTPQRVGCTRFEKSRRDYAPAMDRLHAMKDCS
jgi:hypothetical protein